jgi:hypothetical protein
MSVKLIVLKSYEDVIAEVTAEDINGNWIEITNPFVTRLEEDNSRVVFFPYIPLSKDKTIKIPSDWIVTMVEPLDEVKNSYMEQLNEKSKDLNTEE